MDSSRWYKIKMYIKLLSETDQACLVKVNGIKKFKGWAVWLPKGCIQSRYNIVLHKSMTLTLFIPTKQKDEIRQGHKMTAEDFYNLTNGG